ncbi:MAG: DUF6020 family protein [Eubacteriales bacterium]|nr:DUF6020 family protein [Eubacteriales bacterium]
MKDNSLKKNGILAIISYISLYGIQAMLKTKGVDAPVNNSIFSVLIVVGVFFLLREAGKSRNFRLGIISCILGFLFSSCMVFGTNLLTTSATTAIEGSTNIDRLETWLSIIAGTPMFAATITLLYRGAQNWNEAIQWQSVQRNSKKGLFFLVWGIVFLSWLPALIATYPGIDGYDTIYQIANYQSGQLSSHHPIIHTFLLGFCVDTLGSLFRSVETGFLIYSLVQMLILSAAFAEIYAYLYRCNVSRWLRIVLLLTFMLLPTNAIMAISSTKDILYAAFFAMMLLRIAEAYRDVTILQRKDYWIGLNIVTLLSLMFRKQGIFVLLIGAIAGLILLNRYRKQIGCFVLVCIVESALYFGPISDLLGVVNPEYGGIKEMMSVPCVQLSRALVQKADQLTEEEKQLIMEYIPGYEGYIWQPGIADTMKGTLNVEKLTENLGEFIKLYLKVGAKLPKTYMDAFARLSIGLWYPDMNYRDWGAFHPYWEYLPAVEDQYYERTLGTREREKGENVFADFYEDISYRNTYQKIPLVSVLFSAGAISWAMFLFIGYCIYSKRYKLLVPISLVFGVWLIQMVGPVVLYRYIYPLVVSAPIFIGMLFARTEADFTAKIPER